MKKSLHLLFIPLALSISCGDPPEEANASQSANSVQSETENSGPSKRILILEDGQELLASANGLEENLLARLESDSERSDSTWIDFDRLEFNDGSSEINMEVSEEQLENTASILRALKNEKMIVGGFLERGTPAEDMLLSQQRAQAVVNALIMLGVDATRLRAEGYGPQGVEKGQEKVAISIAGF